MDFLKSAVASAISKGPAFGYNFGDRVDVEQSIWTLHNGTKREDGSKCSIFSFDVTANKSRLPLARNALRKLRTIRHPGVIKVLDTVETESYIYIATERLVPLGWHIKRKSLAEETIKWGLHNVAKTIKFINNEATSIHGCLRSSSVFTSESGEWKLGGFDVLSSLKEDEAIIYTHGGLVPDSARYAPPEVAKSGWDSLKRYPVHCVDAYNYGSLVHEAFNGSSMGSDQLSLTKGIPRAMHQSYKRLIAQDPKIRLSTGQFLDQGLRHGGFFQTPLIQITEDIDGLGLKADAEREEFLSQLDEVSDDFPEEFFKMKVLPELLKSVEYGGGGPKVFGVVMKISTKLTDEEYDGQITPVIVRLFTLPDRAIRVCLLDNLPLMIDHLSNKIVNDKIFPQLVTGFTDIAPVVREQTVKAILTVVQKLSDRTINGELLRYLAKTANDEQPGIRTNTTICLGKIARNLGSSSRSKVLSAAFARSLRDPFVHARNAGLLALAATADLFSEDDCASKMLPAICPSLVDKEKLVRDQANKTMDIYLQRIRKYAQSLPDTVAVPQNSTAATAGAPRIGTPQGDSSSWAGWAISSFTNKIAGASGEMHTGTNGSTAAPSSLSQPSSRPSSVPPKSPNVPHKPSGLSKASKANPFSSAKSGPLTSSVNADVEAEDFGDAWGDMDDDDSNANAFNHPDSTSKPSSETDDTAHAFEDPWGTPTVTTGVRTTKTATYDDGGEPDFAGWLAAQAETKKPVSKPLPKGLAKASASAIRPSVGLKSNSTGNVTAKKTHVSGVTKAVAPAPKKNSQPAAEEEEEEAWGEAWE
ncbi:ARM repeat-containing protein [Pseudovirgaria hyperparasitica]|uniref:ARM repeat-containing protein n=1 Tax=Pseudovirgaria hyperparasitica TaxID=470096 RepID=A0A6A6WC63_9PEZI|nr:ARM repeat-containing protein [Pseudovirgaria hyperparasitica]KAF2759634.1 ARM repeat-containing protein [Pseudovirgaria hyperparasitica]